MAGYAGNRRTKSAYAAAVSAAASCALCVMGILSAPLGIRTDGRADPAYLTVSLALPTLLWTLPAMSVAKTLMV